MNAETMSVRKIAFALAGAVLILIFLLIFVDVQQVVAIIRSANLKALGISFLFLATGFLVSFARWYMLMRQRVSLGTILHTDSIAYMIRMFTPIYVPILRVITLSGATGLPVSDITASMLAERILETSMRLLAAIFALMLIFQHRLAPLWIFTWAVLAAVLLSIVHYLSNHIDQLMPRLIRRLKSIRRLNAETLQGSLDNLSKGIGSVGGLRFMVPGVILSLAMWICFWFFQVGVLIAIKPDNADPLTIAIIAALVLVVIPPSMTAMIGMYQGVVMGVLLPFSFNNDLIAAYSLLSFGSQLVLWLILGSWGLVSTKLNLKNVLGGAQSVIATKEEQIQDGEQIPQEVEG